MKKTWLILLFGLTLVSLVSAVPNYGLSNGLGYGVSQLIEIVESISYPVAEALFGSSDYMFEKVLFLLILISAISVAINQIKIFKGDKTREKAIRWIVTVSISLMAVRFLIETDLVKAMMLPYGVLGVVMTSVLPFVIYFFFVLGVFPYDETTAGSKIGRKMMWIFFAVVFIGVWSSRSEELGDLSWIYFFTAFASVIFFLLDGTIGRRVRIGRLRRHQFDRDHDSLMKAEERLDKLREDYLKQPTDRILERKIKETEKLIEDLRKSMNKRL